TNDHHADPSCARDDRTLRTTNQQLPTQEPRAMTSRIPTLDIRRFDTDRDAFVAELGAAYREWGFAGINGHGIPQAEIDAAYGVFKAFFALPEDTKKQYHVPGGGGARGYTPFG